MDKKRHHYVPKAYLKFFCDEEGKIRMYLKDDPDKVIHQAPDNAGFHKYYYSQPLPEGGMDHNTLEDVFSDIEAKWPPIVERLQQCENVNDTLPPKHGRIITRSTFLHSLDPKRTSRSTNFKIVGKVYRVCTSFIYDVALVSDRDSCQSVIYRPDRHLDERKKQHVCG